MTKPYYTIKTEDVGTFALRAFGRRWPVSDFLGRVLARDIGKRVYLNPSGFLQVESDRQRDQREHNENNARYFLTRDGERLKGPDGGPHSGYWEAIGALHRVFGAGSAHHAMTYEGFAIQRIDFALPDDDGKHKHTTEGN